MADDLLSGADGPAHLLTLNRPARRNALTPEFCRDLAEEIERVSAAGEARVILLAGAGGHFCVGLDLHWLQSLGSSPSLTTLQRGMHDFQSAILAIVHSPLPVVALLDGSCAGFGLDLAAACDIRLAGPGATFTSAFARMGLVPDGGSTLTLPLLMGQSRALRFLLAGETLDAPSALRSGLVDEVVEGGLLEGGRALVARMATNAETSVRTIKRLCRAAEFGALEQALAAEGAAQIQALQSPEFGRRLAEFASRTAAAGTTGTVHNAGSA
jgi:enoyl-CoA hydratase/carnithine racemase